MRASFETLNMRDPASGQGSRWCPVNLDFSAGNQSAIIDLTQEQGNGIIDFIQSIYIDNSLNPSSLVVTFPTFVDSSSFINRAYNITVQPFYQGWFPVPGTQGSAQFFATGGSGLVIPCTVTNFPVPYFATGPSPGIQQIPALINAPTNLAPAVAGDNIIVPGVGGETVRLYRGMWTVSAATTVTVTDGPGGAVLGAFDLFQGGSMTFQASGQPWFVTSAGHALVFNLSLAANLRGTFGYAQS